MAADRYDRLAYEVRRIAAQHSPPLPDAESVVRVIRVLRDAEREEVSDARVLIERVLSQLEDDYFSDAAGTLDNTPF